MSFTPGPWKVDAKSVGGFLVSTQAEPVHEIANVYTNARGRENAHLIAAAPQMLQVLETIFHSCFELHEPLSVDHLALMKSVIQLAHGRSFFVAEAEEAKQAIEGHGL